MSDIASPPAVDQQPPEISSPASEIVQNHVSPPAPEVKSVEFDSATLDAFWSEVLAGLPDRLAGHLEKNDGLAISGPNKLEISFPPGYVLGRQFCERPETLRRIAEIAGQIAGRPIDVTVKSSQNGADVPSPRRVESQQQSAGRRKKASVEGDPFVQQALDVFGGTLIDARSLHETVGAK